MPKMSAASQRRPHRKSRLGCQECKRRHIKCDEARPVCENCSTLSRQCIYRLSASRPIQSLSASPTRSPHTLTSETNALDPASSSPGIGYSTPGGTTTSSLDGTDTSTVVETFASTTTSPSLASRTPSNFLDPPLNMYHMELFSNFILVTAPTLDERNPCPPLDARMLEVFLPTVLGTPYLMYEVLALSALHMSHLKSEYHEAAIALQNQALYLFNASIKDSTDRQPVPMLMFTGFLGLHALADTVIKADLDPDGFLDSFVTYLDLHRGVQSIINSSWSSLMQSSISQFLDRTQKSLAAAPAESHEQATRIADHLDNLLDHADMVETSESACREAVVHLKFVYQHAYITESASQDGEQPIGIVWAWPILLSGGFTSLLMKRKPEALIILCHYAVLLHQRRHMWFVRNGGYMLIAGITKFLGSYWKQWLIWPNEMIL